MCKLTLVAIAICVGVVAGCASPLPEVNYDRRDPGPPTVWLLQEHAGAWGIDCQPLIDRAWEGDVPSLRQMLLFSMTDLDGCYSEEYADCLLKVLVHVGDEKFSAVLRQCKREIADEISGYLLFGYGYDAGSEHETVRTFVEDFPLVAACCRISLDSGWANPAG